MTIEKFKENMNDLLNWMNEKVHKEKMLSLSQNQYNELLDILKETEYTFVTLDSKDDTDEINGYISLRKGLYPQSNKKSPILISKNFNAYLAYALIYDEQLVELSEPLFLTIEPFYAGKPIDDISLMKKGSKTLDVLYQLACSLDEEIDNILKIIEPFK